MTKKGSALSEQASICRDRRERLRVVLAREGLGALVVRDAANLRYLSGFDGRGWLLVGVGGQDLLVTDGRYRGQAAVTGLSVRIARGLVWLADVPAEVGPVALEEDAVTWAQARQAAEALGASRLRPVASPVTTLRMVKHETEIVSLRRAAAVTEQALGLLVGHIGAGRRERDVADAADRCLREAGAAGRAFDTIVSSGPNTANPHHRATDRVIERGDVVMVDLGATVEGYGCDVTRMFSIGPPSRAVTEVATVVSEAWQRAIVATRPGRTGSEVDAAARGHLQLAGHGEHFPHATGHGVGLAAHEPPMLRPGSSDVLAASTVVAIEPAVYLEGRFGLRFEDTLLIRDGSPECLTAGSPRIVEL